MISNLNVNTDEYLRGMRAAKDGKPAEVGASDDYNDGYRTQYEAEQSLTEMGLMQDRLMGMAI